MKKILILIIDGLGDIKYKELDNKTPLMTANHPNMDMLARKGSVGFVQIMKDIAPESDEAMLTILGLNPYKSHRGRGILEAYGAGTKFNLGDIIFRVNFAIIKANKIADLRAERPTNKVAKAITNIINHGLSKTKFASYVKFIATKEHRAVMILKNKNQEFNCFVEGNNPAYKTIKNFVTTALPTNKRNGFNIKKFSPLKKDKKTIRTAKFLNELIKKIAEILNDNANKIKIIGSKANYVLLRGASWELPYTSKALKKKLRKKFSKWYLISDMPVEIGIGKAFKMGIAKPKKDLAKQIKNIFKRYNIIYTQIKDADIAAHDGNIPAKVKAIEDIDYKIKQILEALRKGKIKDIGIVITGDHETRCDIKAHGSGLVPLLIYNSSMPKPPNQNTYKQNSKLQKNDFYKYPKFDERLCKNGELGIINGTNLLNTIEKKLK